jgi:hypothetical protein
MYIVPDVIVAREKRHEIRELFPLFRVRLLQEMQQ